MLKSNRRRGTQPGAKKGGKKGPKTASLEGGALNVLALRLQAKEELCLVLDSVRGKKALVLDPRLAGPLGLVAGINLLKEHDVEKVYQLGSTLITECRNIIYLVTADMRNMLHIAAHINHHTERGQRKEYAIYFVPKRTLICERLLADINVYADVSIGEFHMDLIPFETDLLSMEMHDVLRQTRINSDNTPVACIARALMKLQIMFGIIPHIRGQGPLAKRVADMLLRMRRELGADDVITSTVSEIDSLILIDRSTDLMTPLMIQMTYEGMIDEVMGIQDNFVQLDGAILAVGDDKERYSPGKRYKTPLNSNDKLFAELRDCGVAAVGKKLNAKAKEVAEFFAKKDELQSISEIKGFIGSLGDYQGMQKSAQMHANLVERVYTWTNGGEFANYNDAEKAILAGNGEKAEPYIEALVAKEAPIERVLRLLCLRSLVDGGVKSRFFDHIRKEIVQQYGYEWLHPLLDLEKLGTLKPQDKLSIFRDLSKSMSLLSSMNQTEIADPADVAYVYAGYAPLSIRILEGLLQTLEPNYDEKELEKQLKSFPQPTVTVNQNMGKKKAEEGAPANKITLVFFIGGVTFAEVSAVRFIGSKHDKRDFIVGTTDIVNGNTYVRHLSDTFYGTKSGAAAK